jgi:hypothetical protein
MLLAVFSLFAAKIAPASVSLSILASAFVVPILLLRVTRDHFATEVPRIASTVGAISSLAISDEMEDLWKRGRSLNRQEVWEVVRYLTATNAGITPAMVKRDTRFAAL